MKTLRVIGLLSIGLLLSSPALAADIGVFFSQDGTVTDMFFQQSTPFNVHIVMQNVDHFADAVEFKVNMPAQLIVLGQSYSEGAIPFAYLGSPLGAVAGVQVGLGDCIIMNAGMNPNFKVLTLSVMAMQAMTDEAISVEGFPGPQGDASPRYNVCNTNTKVPMGAGSATFSVAVPNDEPSWGAVKASFE